MTNKSPMQQAYEHVLHSYNPLEIKDILLHGAARKATKHKTEDDILTFYACLLYTSPSPRDNRVSRMPSSA